MKEKLIPILAVVAAACAGPQATKSPEPKIKQTQCTTAAEALKAIGAEKEGLQPDGTFVTCVSSEDVALHGSHLVLRGAQLEAMKGGVEKVCKDVAKARGCDTKEAAFGPNRVRKFDVKITCPDASQDSVCNTSVEIKTTDYGHCVTGSGTDIFCARAKADPNSVIENPPQPDK